MSINDPDTETKELYLKLKEQFPDAMGFLSKSVVDDKYICMREKISEILQRECACRGLKPKQKKWIVGNSSILL